MSNRFVTVFNKKYNCMYVKKKRKKTTNVCNTNICLLWLSVISSDTRLEVRVALFI